MADNVKDLFKQAITLTSKGQIDKAIEAYKSIIKQTPTDARVLNNLGDLYLRKKMNIEAVDIFSRLAKVYEDDGYALRTIAICQKVLKIDPDAPSVRMRMAEIYAKQGLAAEAKNQYLALANYFDKHGQIKEALEVFRKLADLDPSNLGVRVKLATMFQKERMVKQAVAEWLKAAEGYLKLGQGKEAEEILMRCIEADPGTLKARTLLGAERIKKEDYQKAIEILKPPVDAKSADLEALKLFAAALLKTQRYGEAAQALLQAHEKDPASVPIKENLGLSLLKSGNVKAASEHLQKVIAQHIRENRWERAIKLAEELHTADPGDTNVLQKLVEVYTQKNEVPGLIRTYAKLAEAYEAKGLKKNVLGIYEKLIEHDPANVDYLRKVEALRGELGVKHLEEPQPKIEEAVAAAPVEIEEESELEEAVAAVALEGSDYEGEEIVFPEEELEEQVASVDSPLVRAEKHLKQGLLDEAAAELTKLLKTEHSLEAMKLLKEVDRLGGRNADYIKVCFDLAAELRRQDRAEEALAEMQDILAVDKNNARAREILADLVLKMPAEPVEEVQEKPAKAPETTVKRREEPVTPVQAQVPAEPVAAPAEIMETEDLDAAFGEGPEEFVIDMETEVTGQASAPPPGPPGLTAMEIPEEDFEAVEELDLESFRGSPKPVASREPVEVKPTPPPRERAPVTPTQAVPASPPPQAGSEVSPPLVAGPPRVEAPPQVAPSVPPFVAAAPEIVAPPPAPATAQRDVTPPTPAAEPPPGETSKVPALDLEELAAEADFYYQQGLFSEAQKVYRQILALDPGRAKLQQRLQEIEAVLGIEGEPESNVAIRDLESFAASLEVDLSPGKESAHFRVAPEAPREEARPLETEGFQDLLSDLRQELEPPPAPVSSRGLDEGLDEIFQEFQHGVKEQLSEEDYETHYNLGIAYKEMGLLDEAMSEFQLAARSKEFFVDAVSMMALCHQDKGDIDQAVATIENVLEDPSVEPEGRKGLLWEMASMLEKRGDRKRAADIYLSIYELDKSFKGIQEKIKALEGVDEPAEQTMEEILLDVDMGGAEPPLPEIKPGPKKSSRVSYL